MSIFIQINGLTKDKGSGIRFPKTRSEWVPYLRNNNPWRVNGQISIFTTFKSIRNRVDWKHRNININKVIRGKWLASLNGIFGDLVDVIVVWRNEGIKISRFLISILKYYNGGRSECWMGVDKLSPGGWPPCLKVPLNSYQKVPKARKSKDKDRTYLINKVDSKCESERERERERERESESSARNRSNIPRPVKIMISVVAINAIIVRLLLLQQNVERNPGPLKENPNFTIMTYNTNGLGDRNKFKRLLLKLEPIVSKGGIILLQETHITHPEILKTSWKNGFAINGSTTNSAGLITLFSDQYKVLEEYSDNNGRQLIVAIEKEDEEKLIVVNTYFPNDHKQSLGFANQLFEKIIQFQQNYPDHHTIFAGDLNVCLSREEDSLNRNQSKNEEIIARLIVENNKVINVVDAYRRTKPKSGYTWKRGTCYSRLDYFFVSNEISHRISGSNIDWAFESSDHAALKVNILVEDIPKKGPGLTRINTKILEDAGVTKKIGEEIEQMMNQTDESWNPHAKLEFLKVCIRSVFASNVSEIKGQVKEKIKEKEEELNQIEELKIITLEKENKSLPPQEENLLDKIDKAALALKQSLAQLRSKFSDDLRFSTNAKWFEYGEKSNKFFLNLNKSRQKQKLINKIRKDNNEFVGQENVSKCIKEFYKDLYAKQQTCPEEDNLFYSNCPKLPEKERKYMDETLKLEDLKAAMATCKDSMPGPDGIPYLVYKKFWRLTGPIILDAWNYSILTGNLAPSHVESVITLLPKEGKDRRDIKNWRPITLSNCDSKIITKAISIKMSKVLDLIIDKSQTAYVPGRSVMDNLRANFYVKGKCKKKKINSVLISLDAKKAFDSVDHSYIRRTLEAYGFGEHFIKTFQTLYKDISARILVNGFTTEPIKIERGVKQGDALSCSIFIICIDPLLRNLNSNSSIGEIKTRSGVERSFKAAAYADDISVVCKNSTACIQQVFKEYERLTNLSGLELNADKTEILSLHSNEEKLFSFEYNQERYHIRSVRRIKICGLFYCTDEKEEYELNVIEKHNKLKSKIRAWSHRNWTLEGKILIVKTFGLSQLIYNMQSYNFKEAELTNIERTIFGFLWSNSEKKNGIDRIKRSILKNDYCYGGLNVTDVDCLNRALKLRQFLRSSKSNH